VNKKLIVLGCAIAFTSSIFSQLNVFSVDVSGGAKRIGAIHQFDVETGIKTSPYQVDKVTGEGGPTNQNVLRASNGKYYGLTRSGGTAQAGEIFSYNPTNQAYQTVYSHLPIGADGPLQNHFERYNLTDIFFTNTSKSVYKFDASTEQTTLFFEVNLPQTFAYSIVTGLKFVNEKLYFGVYNSGNSNYEVMQYHIPTSTLTTIISQPYSQLPSMRHVHVQNDVVYIMGEYEISRYDFLTSTFERIYTSGYGSGTYTDPANFNRPVIINDNLFVTSQFGGTNDGTLISLDLFSLTPTLTNLTNGVHGAFPGVELIQSGDNLIFTTKEGSAANAGKLLSWDRFTNEITVLHSFTQATKGNFGFITLDYPLNGNETASNTIFGLSYNGGLAGKGAMYFYDLTTQTESLKISFGQSLSTVYNLKNDFVQKDNLIYSYAKRDNYGAETILYSYDLTDGTIINLSTLPAQVQDISNLKLFGDKLFFKANNNNFNYFLYSYDLTTEEYTLLPSISNFGNLGLMVDYWVNNSKMYVALIAGNEFTSGSLNDFGGIVEIDIANSTASVFHAFTESLAGFQMNFALFNNILFFSVPSSSVSTEGKIYSIQLVNPNDLNVFFDFANSTEVSNPNTIIIENNVLYGTASKNGTSSDSAALYKISLENNGLTLLQVIPRSVALEPSNKIYKIGDKLFTSSLYSQNPTTGLEDKGSIFSYDLITEEFEVLMSFDTLSWNASNFGGLAFYDLCVDADYSVSRVDNTFSVTTPGATYAWVNCANEAVVLSTNSTFTATETGTYRVIFSKGSCLEYSECFNVEIVGTNELAVSSFEMYPNPTSSELTLANLPTEGTITVLDLSGKKLMSKTISNATEKLVVNQLSSGIYLVAVSTAQGQITKRLVIR